MWSIQTSKKTTWSLLGVTLCLCSAIVFGVVHSRWGDRAASSRKLASTRSALPVNVPRSLKGLPLTFEPNVGQTNSQVRYLSHGSGYELFLTDKETVLALAAPHPAGWLSRTLPRRPRSYRETVVRMSLAGANPTPRITPLDPQLGTTSYFIGQDPKGWRTSVKSFAKLNYHDVYPGIDMAFYGNQQRLEYDFIVAPGANPKSIALNIEGARKLRVDDLGNLLVQVPGGELTLQKPLVYQKFAAGRRAVSGEYAVAGPRTVRFNIAPYDSSEPLIVDPILDYSTYVGGSGNENGDGFGGIAVDAAGDAYITGETLSTNFPTTTNGLTQAPQPGNVNGTVFITEINPSGTAALFSTYLSSSDFAGEAATSIALDSATPLDLYVTGFTVSAHFPTTSNAFERSIGSATGGSVAFMSKITLSTTPTLAYSTYVGGPNNDAGSSVAVDAGENAYVAGLTMTPGLAVGGFQTTLNGSDGNGFLAKINTSGSGTSSLLYYTYIGGSGTGVNNTILSFGDIAMSVAADSSGRAYVTGATSSSSFPVTSSTAFQASSTTAATNGSAFFTLIDTTKTSAASLLYSTYLGGKTFATATSTDFGFGIALGPQTVSGLNLAYLTGSTGASDFPTKPNPGAFQTTGPSTGVEAVFFSVMDPSQSQANSLVYSTYLRGTGGDEGLAIAADPSGNAYLTGVATSTNFYTTQGAIQAAPGANCGGDPFVVKLNPGGNGTADVLYSTLFGGSGDNTASPGCNSTPDFGLGIAIDSSANAYITGSTASANFPISPKPGAFQTVLNGPNGASAPAGTQDAFIAKLPLLASISVQPGALNFQTQLVPPPSPNPYTFQTVTVTNNTSSAVSFSSYSVGTANYTAAPDATNGCSQTENLAVGASCVIDVTFTPTAASGVLNDTLTIHDTLTGDTTQTVSLTGVATASAGVATIAPSTGIAFGNVNVGSKSSPQTVTITNTGNQNLSLTSINTSLAAFPITDTCTTTLAPTKNCTVSVTFAPTAAGAVSGDLSISASDDNGSPHQVPLSGTGIASTATVSVAPATLTFGGQLLTTTSAPQNVVITNTGTAAATITSITTTGDFSQTNNCGSSVGAAGSCTIMVTFAPTSTTNPRTGTLTIISSDSGSPHVVSLTGSGWNFSISAPSSITVAQGSSGTLTLTMTPLGGFTGSVSLTCSGAPARSSCTASPATLAASNGTTAQTASIDITTSGWLPPPGSKRTPPISPRQVMFILIALAMLVCIGRTRRLRARLGLSAACLVFCFLAGCSASNGTQKGSYTLTLTGASSTVTHSVSVTLTVD